jgi:beta-glucosidase
MKASALKRTTLWIATTVLALNLWACGDEGSSSEPTSTDSEADAGADSEDSSSSDDAVEDRVSEILSGLTIDEKIGQMVQAQFEDVSVTKIRSMCIGSVFNGGEEPVSPNEPVSWATAIDTLQEAAMDGCGIPILYGLDAVHGNAKVIGSTVFPHNIGIGAAGDADLAARIGQATARECRGAGIHMAFAPSISVARDERWGRTYESFGETPEINAEMGAAYVMGLQGMGDLSDPGAVAATAKHYVGDGGTAGGVNAGEDLFSEETMRAIHLPPYEAAIAENLSVVMPSYHKWVRDDVAYPMTVDTYSITDMLKGELGFDGFCLSDYDAIPHSFDLTLATYTEDAVVAAVSAGIDMAMIAANQGMDEYIEAIRTGLEEGRLYEQWINDSVSRILRVKVRMGLFENPYSNPDLMEQIWSEEHQELAREAVRKSLVLLKNNNDTLPLSKSETVAVLGPFADMMGAQAGGWTIGWQGEVTYDTTEVMGETIRTGMQEVGGDKVVWDQNGETLADADKVVVVLAETPYAEGEGDHDENRHSIYLKDLLNYDLLTKAVESGKPVILVLMSGRPMIIEPSVLDSLDAFVEAWLPGSRGIGVADVLYGGDYNFTGKLPHTWPADFDQIPVNVNKQDDEPGFDAEEVEPLFPYGFGLTY